MSGQHDAVAPEVQGPFDIYESADGPHHVANPVRRRILAMMQGRERTVPEMIALTGLGKSTLSAHLAQLSRERLLDYREDPNDRRCKRYYLTSRHVGTAGPRQDRPPVLDPDHDLPLEQGGAVPRLLLRSLVAELACCGLDMGPVVKETGKRVGELMGRANPADDVDHWLQLAGGLWAETGLGRLVVEDRESLLVSIRACRLCCRRDSETVPLCQITAGLLEGMASESLGSLVEVVKAESSLQLPPDDHEPGVLCACTFRLRVAAHPPKA